MTNAYASKLTEEIDQIIRSEERAVWHDAISFAVEREFVIFEKRVLEHAIDQIGWPDIHEFQNELKKGQSYDEDAGGFFLRAISRLFRIQRRRDPVLSYQEAARALFWKRLP